MVYSSALFRVHSSKIPQEWTSSDGWRTLIWWYILLYFSQWTAHRYLKINVLWWLEDTDMMVYSSVLFTVHSSKITSRMNVLWWLEAVGMMASMASMILWRAESVPLKKDYYAIINRKININIVAIFYLKNKIKMKARNYGVYHGNLKGIDRTGSLYVAYFKGVDGLSGLETFNCRVYTHRKPELILLQLDRNTHLLCIPPPPHPQVSIPAPHTEKRSDISDLLRRAKVLFLICRLQRWKSQR